MINVNIAKYLDKWKSQLKWSYYTQKQAKEDLIKVFSKDKINSFESKFDVVEFEQKK